MGAQTRALPSSQPSVGQARTQMRSLRPGSITPSSRTPTHSLGTPVAAHSTSDSQRSVQRRPSCAPCAKAWQVARGSSQPGVCVHGAKSGAGNVASAKLVGKAIAERARARGIESVVFDRGGYLYHGRVKALAEAAREGGLKF